MGTFTDRDGDVLAFDQTKGVVVCSNEIGGVAVAMTPDTAMALAAELVNWARASTLREHLARHKAVLAETPDHVHANLMVAALELELAMVLPK